MNKFLKIFSILLCVTALNTLLFPYHAGAVFDEESNTGMLKNKRIPGIPESQQVLAVLRTDVDVKKSQKGEIFVAKTMDDILMDSKTILIPAESVLSGEILKVKKPGFIFKDAYIEISINKVENPSGEIFVLNPPFITEIYDPKSKKIKHKLITRLPSSIASSGSSFLLGQMTSMARSAIWGISTGAGIAGGIFSALVMPDKNETTGETCAKRAFGSTPPGTFKSIMSKGKNFKLKAGEFINIHFDKKSVKLMMDDFSSDKT